MDNATPGKGSVCVMQGSIFIILEATPALEVVEITPDAKWKVVNQLPPEARQTTQARIAVYVSNGSHGYLVQCPGGLIVCPHDRPVFFCANEDLIAMNQLLRDVSDGNRNPS